MSSNNKNLICRVCVSRNHETNSIYCTDNFLGSEIQIFEVMKACASVEIALPDGLPQQICSKCLHQLHQSFAFKSLCELSDYNLRLDLVEGVKNEEDSDGLSELTDTNIEENSVYLNNESPNIDKESAIDIKKGLQIIKLLEMNGEESEKNFLEECEFYFDNKSEDSNELLPLSKDINCTNNETLKNESKSKWYCNECKKQFQFPSIYNIHMKRHTVGAPFQCEVCKLFFTKKEKLSSHKLAHNPKQKCGICNQTFTTRNARNRHRRDAHPPTSFKCHFCHQNFTVLADLQKHIAAHTEKRQVYPSDKIFVCDFCFRRFDDSDSLAEHKNVHAGERRKNRPGFPYGRRTNTDGNMFVCDFCPRSFNDLLSLTKHKALHIRYKSVNGTKSGLMLVKTNLEKT